VPGDVEDKGPYPAREKAKTYEMLASSWSLSMRVAIANVDAGWRAVRGKIFDQD
jgi:hypothetical protein